MAQFEIIPPPTITDIDPTKVYVTYQDGPANAMNDLLRAYGKTVAAPLPEKYGVGVGSEYTQPLAAFIPTGFIQTVMALRDQSFSSGFSVRKYYAGTAQPDIPFEMEFVAHSDAFNEVIVPVMALYAMSASCTSSINKSVANFIAKYANIAIKAAEELSNSTGISKKVIGSNINVNPNTLSGQQVRNYLQWLQGPPTVMVSFGTTYTVGNCVISEMNPEFTDVLDYNGLPMQCTVSLNLVLRDPFILDGPYGVASSFVKGYR